MTYGYNAKFIPQSDEFRLFIRYIEKRALSSFTDEIVAQSDVPLEEDSGGTG